MPSWATDFRRQMPRALTDRGSRQLRTKRQDLSHVNKLALDGRWVGAVEHVDEPDPASLIHFGIEEDFDAFVASGQYRHATTYPRKRLDLGSNTSESTRKFDERAFVVEGVQNGDLIIYPEGGEMSFVLRKLVSQGCATEHTFLGPALYDAWRDEWTELPVEELVMI